MTPQAARAWWQALQPDPAQKRGGDRGALARLRRCATVGELMLEPQAIALFRRLGGTSPADLPRVALAAGVLACVRKDVTAQKVARRIGPADPDKPETALLKPLRFRRLMEAATGDDRLLAFRRLVAIAGAELNAADLADALLNWNDRLRQIWVYDYWNAGAAPAETQKPATEETHP
jgi:CRISPR system Cascade subunit CasB